MMPSWPENNSNVQGLDFKYPSCEAFVAKGARKDPYQCRVVDGDGGMAVLNVASPMFEGVHETVGLALGCAPAALFIGKAV